MLDHKKVTVIIGVIERFPKLFSKCSASWIYRLEECDVAACSSADSDTRCDAGPPFDKELGDRIEAGSASGLEQGFSVRGNVKLIVCDELGCIIGERSSAEADEEVFP